MRLRLLLMGLLATGAVAQEIDVLPTPQYAERLSIAPALSYPLPLQIAQPHLQIAADTLKGTCRTVRFRDGIGGIVLWDYSAAKNPAVELNFLDRLLLEETALRSQSYVLKTTRDRVFVIGGGREGVLYGAATLAQLLVSAGDGVRMPGTYIRDWPDFHFRAASDWLLHVEVNRWALDRGQGWDAYTSLVKQKLNRAAGFKINMALIDGFGWSLERRTPGYAPVMLELNRYARARGIRLLYGGYGAAYDNAPIPGEYQGQVFFNRETYPDGPLYQCLAFPEKKSSLDPRTLGSCRGNDELNKLKAENIAQFVDAIEPGAVYIHHEDCCVFEDFQKAWLGRCERCRRRWPNDSLLAADGGAGALAHGYSAIIDAINRIRHTESGYDASRDSEIVIVSPVYMPATSRSDDWAQVLELWRLIAQKLPRASNVQIGLRETLPQPGGGKRWVELFNSVMRREQLPFGAFTFVVGGADEFLSDYAMSGIPALNAHFLGSRSIYNAMGDAYREPMELLAAQYSWNIRGDGFYRDLSTDKELEGVEDWIYHPQKLTELFGPGKLFDRICARLYGARAGTEMAAYYRDMVWMPEGEPAKQSSDRPFYRGRQSMYLPRTWNYLTAIPEQWNHLLVDEMTWAAEPTERYRAWAKPFDLALPDLHNRLARRWRLAAELNSRATTRVKSALAAAPNPDSVPDLHYLLALFSVDQPLLAALRDYHGARAKHTVAEAKDLLHSAHAYALEAERLALDLFPRPVDAAQTEVRALPIFARKLADAIDSWGRQGGGLQ